ncbi:MAG TPA: flavin reductase family protein [Acidimicrobiales bacterium]|nr:flavin reductase family protein [Acidimicrobiales bacterium]
MGRFASGVTVVAAIEDGQPIGFTCQSFVSLSLDPPLIAICPAKSSTSWPKMISAGRFSVNVLAGDQAGEATAFAVSGGDKFEGVGWRIGRFGTPIIDGVVVSIECDLRSIHETGDHELVVGEVLALDASDRDPLIFYRGRFTSLPDICSADVRTDP